jgi:hypothetical protein
MEEDERRFFFFFFSCLPFLGSFASRASNVSRTDESLHGNLIKVFLYFVIPNTNMHAKRSVECYSIAFTSRKELLSEDELSLGLDEFFQLDEQSNSTMELHPPKVREQWRTKLSSSRPKKRFINFFPSENRIPSD